MSINEKKKHNAFNRAQAFRKENVCIRKKITARLWFIPETDMN